MRKNIKFMKLIFEDKNRVVFLIILIFVHSLVEIFSQYYASHIMDIINYSNDGNIILFALNILLKIFLVFVFETIFEYFKEYYKLKILSRFRNNLRKMVSMKINSYSYESFKENDTGKFISWLSTDVGQISNYGFNSFFDMYKYAFTFFISILFIFFMSPLISIVVFLMSIFTLVMPIIFNNIIDKVSREKSKANDEFTEEIKNYILGYDVFTLNSLKKIFFEKIMKSSYKYEKKYFEYTKKVRIVYILRKLFSMIPFTITLGIAAFSIVKYNLPMRHFLGTILICNITYGAIISFFSVKATLDSTIPIFEKYTIEVDEEELDKEKEDISEIDSNKIKVSNISFSYKEGKEILKNFSTEFAYPSKYFIVGKSGGGKTTLLKLIQGLYEVNSGEISIGDKNIKNLSKKSLREIFGYLSQDIYLFTGTIRENITLWQEYSDEEIWKVLKMCKIEEYVKSLEKGLDTVILENGKNISGGQRQRIGLSRLLLRNPKYLLIDEGTSQLDEENRLGIEETLLNLEDKGVLIITHNLQENYDKRCSIVEV